MDHVAFLGDIAFYASVVGDGGPRGYRRRGRPLPEKYLPGRFLQQLSGDHRARVVRAVNDGAAPAPWFLRQIVSFEEDVHAGLPAAPVDRRWCRRGRWAIPR